MKSKRCILVCTTMHVNKNYNNNYYCYSSVCYLQNIKTDFLRDLKFALISYDMNSCT